MEVHETIEYRRNLEHMIVGMINDFERDTGLYVTELIVHRADIRGFSKDGDRLLLGDVSVIVSLPRVVE